MSETTETTETTTEDKKPRKPMSQEQKDAISKKLKSLWRKRRAEGTSVAAPKKAAGKVAKKSEAKLKAAVVISPNPVHDGLWRLVMAHGLPAVSRGLAEIKAGLERLAKGE